MVRTTGAKSVTAAAAAKVQPTRLDTVTLPSRSVGPTANHAKRDLIMQRRSHTRAASGLRGLFQWSDRTRLADDGVVAVAGQGGAHQRGEDEQPQLADRVPSGEQRRADRAGR